MGIRKYFYLSLLVAVVIFGFNLQTETKKYRYRCPLPGTTIFLATYSPELSPVLISYAAEIVRSVYGVEPIVVDMKEAPPEQAYHAKRKQYDIDKLIVSAADKLPEDGYKTLILFNQDVFSENDSTNYVLGAGQLGGKVAAISVKRFEIKVGNFLLEKVFHKKILRTLILHELGHTFGLPHCTKRCVMESGNNILNEILKHDRYCRNCESRVASPR